MGLTETMPPLLELKHYNQNVRFENSVSHKVNRARTCSIQWLDFHALRPFDHPITSEVTIYIPYIHSIENMACTLAHAENTSTAWDCHSGYKLCADHQGW